MRNISKEELNEILESHELWLRGEGGKQADLSNVDLRYADLSNVDLRYANLRYVNLRCTNLSNVNLRCADLIYSNLSDADLSDADLEHANLEHTNLEHANLKCVNLTCADLRYTNLQDANLKRADLRCANLEGADLSNADFKNANLEHANLSYTNLTCADLRYTNLQDANLKRADLRCANLEYVKTNIHTIGYNLACPEEGSFIGYKKANGCIVKLLIPEDAKRSSATTSKCRCNKAKVLEIENIKTGDKLKEIRSNYDNNFIYRIGEIVSVDNFDDNRWNECSTGIHFFMNRDNAINY